METKNLKSWKQTLLKRELEEEVLSYVFKPLEITLQIISRPWKEE